MALEPSSIPTESQNVSLEVLLSKHWHHLPLEEVEELLETDAESGLNRFQVQERQVSFGHNRLTQQKEQPAWKLFLSQFNQPLVIILLIAALVTLLLQEWVDSAVIMMVVLVNAIIGYIQEHKALQAMKALALSMEGSARVIRSGQVVTIASAELVPGDLVLLQSGDKVPADLRLIRDRTLKIDESILTGEAISSEKDSATLARETLLADRHNMAYSSTLVTYGSGVGCVVSTGDYTEVGRINDMVASAAAIATPLTQKMVRFSRKLLWMIAGLAGLTFMAGWYHGNPLLETFMASVALAVSAIPEGLPAAMTIILAIGVGKMAQRHAIIRKMPAVETLGSTTVICSDKTGTITQNQMTVQQVATTDLMYEISGTGYVPEGEIWLTSANQEQPENRQCLLACLRAGLLCNDAVVRQEGAEWHTEGDPTELALVTAALKAGLNPDDELQSLPRLDTLPFESQHQYMATLHGCDNGSVIYLKGSVESVLSRCYFSDNAKEDALSREKVEQQVHRMAEKGLRVLALAQRQLSGRLQGVAHEDVAENMCFLGLQAMIDPPRQESVAAIRACQAAGIEVKMITGDHVVTAAVIAKKVGLTGAQGDHYASYAMNGRVLQSLNEHELMHAAKSISVFARVSPEQKLRLVEALQAQGHIVAMTGDGVNDAPALKQANIGVAMGESGTEVAKEAADMVLTNDNFATIKAAVEEGRSVFDNLIKFITWTLPTNVGEGLVVLVAVLFGLTLPITPVQILWINMTTAVLLGLMLAFEKREPGLMARPPRAPDQPVITRELMFRIALVSVMLLICAFGLFEWALLSGESLEYARTMAVNMFVFGEMFYLLNCRSLRYSMFRVGFLSNGWLLLGVAAMTLLQLLFTYAEWMNALFGSAPLQLQHWGLIVGGALLISTVVSIEKWLRLQRDLKANTYKKTPASLR